jgi:Uma2 family endonuclease
MTLVTAKWSVPEYRQMIATGLLDERQVELIAGEIIEMSPEGPEHSFTCDSLGEYLRQQLQGRAKIREAHPISLIDSEPEPDIAIVKLPASQYRDRHPQPADIHWLIEIANSTLTKDLGPKKELSSRKITVGFNIRPLTRSIKSMVGIPILWIWCVGKSLRYVSGF